MIENTKCILEDSTELHADILYSVLLAINLNVAVGRMSKEQDVENGGSGKVDTKTMQAIATSTQVPTVLSMADALAMCARVLIAKDIIDFDTQFDAMWEEREDIHKQMSKEECKSMFTNCLDIKSNSIILNS